MAHDLSFSRADHIFYQSLYTFQGIFIFLGSNAYRNNAVPLPPPQLTTELHQRTRHVWHPQTHRRAPTSFRAESPPVHGSTTSLILRLNLISRRRYLSHGVPCHWYEMRSKIRLLSRFAMLFLGWVSRSIDFARRRGEGGERVTANENVVGAASEKHIMLLLTRSGGMVPLVMRRKSQMGCRLLIYRDRLLGNVRYGGNGIYKCTRPGRELLYNGLKSVKC